MTVVMKKEKPNRNRRKLGIASKIGVIPFALLPGIVPPLAGWVAGYDLWDPYDTAITELWYGREFGSDTRTKVSDSERLTGPVVRIKVINDQGILRDNCTGSAIAATVFVTAAHCVDGDDVQKLVLDRGGAFLSEHTYATKTEFATTTKFVIHDKYNGEENDIALVFTKQPVKSWFKVDEFPIKDAASLKLQTAGYPGDKKVGTMWKDQCKGFERGNIFHPTNKLFSSSNFSYFGQSGSPMYIPSKDRTSENAGKIYAVVHGGPASRDGKKFITNGKSFMLITQFEKEDTDWIKEKINEHNLDIEQHDELSK